MSKKTITFLVGVAISIVLNFGVLRPMNGGFWCDDQSIRHKFEGDSFPTRLLLLLSIFPMMPIFVICEYQQLRQELKEAANLASIKHLLKIARGKAKHLYLEYGISACYSLAFNELIKTLVSEPRPHFVDSCRPDWSNIDCDQNGGYVPFDESLCTSTNDARNNHPRAVFDGMRSFPSGHAQLSCFVAAYAILYLRRRQFFPSHGLSNFFNVWIQFLFAMFGFAASFTRITDHRHHWWDVLAGSVMGSITACLTVHYWCRYFEAKLTKAEIEKKLNFLIDEEKEHTKIEKEMEKKD